MARDLDGRGLTPTTFVGSVGRLKARINDAGLRALSETVLGGVVDRKPFLVPLRSTPIAYKSQPGAEILEEDKIIQKLPIDLDAKVLEKLLRALGAQLEAAGASVSVVVVGGAALALRGWVLRTTQDVEVLAFVRESGGT